MTMLSTLLFTFGFICFITSLIDMGMNGNEHAEWAKIGAPIALACFMLSNLF